jgi:hypothetical protein
LICENAGCKQMPGKSKPNTKADTQCVAEPAARATAKAEAKPAAKTHAMPAIPADEALSILRETRGVSTWTAPDMATSLKISAAEAKQVIAVLEMQGYVNQFKPDEFMTTFAGESTSGSKPPRYARERIEEALAMLRSRIAEINRASSAPFRITEAVAFGDFLSDRTRFQSVEVGIRLEPRKPAAISIVKKGATRQFLRQLRDKVGVVQFRPYEEWMSARSHRNLLR